MYQYAYDDVTDFEICRLKENTKAQISGERKIFFFQIKKFINYI